MPGGDLPLAHGLGGAKDLPISPELAIAGATAALVVSFAVLALAWRQPRYDAATSGRVAPAWLRRLVGSSGWRVGLRVLGVLLAAYTALALVFGKDLVINPALGIFYVWWWVGLVPLSLLLGPVWKAISPPRAIHAVLARVGGTDPAVGMRAYPAWLGQWPAALGLFAFVWMELVYPHSTEIGPVRLWCAVYLAVMLVGGAVFGSTFFANADPFEVYSTLVSRLSVWGRRDGVLVVRSPLANLDATPPRPGLVAVVSVLFGSTAFDSFKDSVPWVQFVQSTGSAFWLDNAALVGFCVAVAAVFAAGTMLTGLGDDLRRRELPRLLAHSVVPIIVGYVVAHYLSYLVTAGQLTLVQVSDPFSNGSDWFGTADLSVNYWLSLHPTLLATIKVLAVVAGHVVGVVAAHDRAVRILPPRHQVTGQLPLLFAMVAFTVGGLYLLFAA